MTSMQRITAAIRRSSQLDRVPVIPLMRFAAIKQAGFRLEEALDDWEIAAEAELAAWRRFGHDAVFARMPLDVDVQALGGTLIPREDNPPQVGPPYLVNSFEDIAKIPHPDPDAHTGMRMERLLAQRLVEALGDETPVVGYCQGPLRFASLLRGIQAFMEDLYENTELVFRLLELVTRVSVIRAKYLVEAGVRMIEVGDPVASGDLISPRFYERFALEYHRSLIHQIHEMGNIYVLLHICGDTSRILGAMVETGADILSLDGKVDLGSARSAVGEAVTLMGNVDPSHILAFGTPEQVRAAALDCIRKAGPASFILSSGCAIGRDTPPENIAALVNAAKEV